MADEKAVETNDQKAATDQKGVETKNTDALGITGEDYEAVLIAKDAELKQISTERDNYRRGMLKAKGKLSEDEDEKNVEGGIELMRQIAREEVLATRESILSAEKDVLIKKIARENSELKLAMKNKSQVSNASQGASNEDKITVKDNILTDTQLKDLKTRGFDDKMVERFKKNLTKNTR